MEVVFDPGPHVYTHSATNTRYISVTQLIDRYVPVFDSDYWSTYKGVKDVLLPLNLFNAYKRSAGGWENVVEYYREFGAAPHNKEIEKRKQWYLDKWQQEKEVACELGTKFHKEMEEIVLGSGMIERDTIPMVVYDGDVDLLHGVDNAVFPELLIYNHKHRLAGQVDLVEKAGQNVWISDYKTCKEISRVPFRDEHMLAPLDELENTNYNHYMMQMSTYGWMLQEFGYKVKELRLIHAHRETGVHLKDYILPFRPDLVEKMLKDYGRNTEGYGRA